jgi:mRNA interferase MazF
LDAAPFRLYAHHFDNIDSLHRLCVVTAVYTTSAACFVAFTTPASLIERHSHMAATITTSIAIQETLFNRAETLAQHLNISQSDLFELALEHFISSHQIPNPNQAAQIAHERLVINQGDIYWLKVENAGGLESDIPHPHVVIQDNVFNHSRIHTVVACALTSNLKRASLPGNILLDAGEANLPRQSVVESSKVSTVDKSHLGELIGSLTEERVQQILAGLRFLQLSFFAR